MLSMTESRKKWKRSELLAKAADEEGHESIEAMLSQAVTDGACPGVCVKCGTVTYEVEPDAVGYGCDECESENCVHSVLVIAGLI